MINPEKNTQHDIRVVRNDMSQKIETNLVNKKGREVKGGGGRHRGGDGSQGGGGERRK